GICFFYCFLPHYCQPDSKCHASGGGDYMQSGDLLSYNNLLLSLLRLAPSQLYTDAATTLRMPSVRSLGPLTIEQMAGVIAEGDPNIAPTLLWNKIGRASCRERVQISVGRQWTE